MASQAESASSVRHGAEGLGAGGEWIRGRFLEFHKNGMRSRFSDVRTGMLLGGEPPSYALRQLEVDGSTTGGQSPSERREGEHDAVRVTMRRCFVAGPVEVLEHPHPLVFKDDPIELRVGDDRIALHASTVALRRRPAQQTTVGSLVTGQTCGGEAC